MSPTEYDSLVSMIYGAATGVRPWKDPLATLSLHLDLWGIQIIGVDKRTGTLMFSLEGGVHPPAAALDYLRSYHAINPRIAPSIATPPDQWMHCHEHFDDDYVASSPFYQEFLIPHGGRYLSGRKLIEDDAHLVFFGALRPQGKAPLSLGEITLLDRLHQHFKHACEIFIHLRQAYSEIGVAGQLLNGFQYPMLLVDHTRGIWFRNDAADQMLNQPGLLIERNGLLLCSKSAADTKLTEVIHGLQLDHPAAPNQTSNQRKIVRLHDDFSDKPMLMYVSALRPEQIMGAFGHAAKALLMIYDPNQQAALDPFIIAESFRLTPAEARVAVHIAQGKSAQQIAEHGRVSLTTVRSQIRSVLNKTGTRRQSDLIRLIASIPDAKYA